MIPRAELQNSARQSRNGLEVIRKYRQYQRPIAPGQSGLAKSPRVQRIYRRLAFAYRVADVFSIRHNPAGLGRGISIAAALPGIVSYSHSTVTGHRYVTAQRSTTHRCNMPIRVGRDNDELEYAAGPEPPTRRSAKRKHHTRPRRIGVAQREE